MDETREQFDPYHKWLGIGREEQPPNHYRLLGIRLFESDPEVISNGADRQMGHIKSFQAGPHSSDSQRLLNEIATAKVCLLNRDRKAEYDRQLHALMQESSMVIDEPLLVTEEAPVQIREVVVASPPPPPFTIPSEPAIPNPTVARLSPSRAVPVAVTSPLPMARHPTAPYDYIMAEGEGAATSPDGPSVREYQDNQDDAVIVPGLEPLVEGHQHPRPSPRASRGRKTPESSGPSAWRTRSFLVALAAVGTGFCLLLLILVFLPKRASKSPIPTNSSQAQSAEATEPNPFLPDGPLRGSPWKPSALPELKAIFETRAHPHLDDSQQAITEIDVVNALEPPPDSVFSEFRSQFDPIAQSLQQATWGYGFRGVNKRKAALARYGGTKGTEWAVTGALIWLARHQNPSDGSWSLKDYTLHCKDKTCTTPGQAKADSLATGMALLPFLAAGQTHKSKGAYQATIAGGLDWLIKHQKPDGDLRAGFNMYAHGVATVALCEAYGLTGDPSMERAAQSAIDFIVAAQNKSTGGWGYNPGDPGETSVVGWQIMGMKSAAMAGLSISRGKWTLDRGSKWLDSCAKGDTGHLYSWTPEDGPSEIPTAVGLLCRQYLGAKRDSPMMIAGCNYFVQPNSLPSLKAQNVHYWYFATQVMHNMPGYEWDTWNRTMRKVLVDSQCRDSHSCANGSWDPEKDQLGKDGGRITMTALNCLTLEIYYRYTPLFRVVAY